MQSKTRAKTLSVFILSWHFGNFWNQQIYKRDGMAKT